MATIVADVALGVSHTTPRRQTLHGAHSMIHMCSEMKSPNVVVEAAHSHLYGDAFPETWRKIQRISVWLSQ